MRGTGEVRIGRGVVYAYFTLEGKAARLRLSADECDQFDLFAGQQVRVGLPDREPAVALVTGVVPAPPFVWVEVEFAGLVSRAG
jgi:hypothetical protein